MSAEELFKKIGYSCKKSRFIHDKSIITNIIYSMKVEDAEGFDVDNIIIRFDCCCKTITKYGYYSDCESYHGVALLITPEELFAIYKQLEELNWEEWQEAKKANN